MWPLIGAFVFALIDDDDEPIALWINNGIEHDEHISYLAALYSWPLIAWRYWNRHG